MPQLITWRAESINLLQEFPCPKLFQQVFRLPCGLLPADHGGVMRARQELHGGLWGGFAKERTAEEKNQEAIFLLPNHYVYRACIVYIVRGNLYNYAGVILGHAHTT